MIPGHQSFGTPRRQSPKAVILILLRYGRILVRQLWPILLVILINPKSDRGQIITGVALAILFLSLVYSLLAYSRYYFFIQHNELCVRSGVFRKKIINVPFDRIQSVDFKRNLVHQLLNVVAINIDTAGSKGSELELDAIELEEAQDLRDVILDYKRTRRTLASDNLASEDQLPPVPEVSEPPQLILQLSPTDLLKVGISENHIRTAAIIFAFFIGLADDLDQLIGWDVYSELERTTTAMKLVGMLAMLLAIPFFIGVSFVITLLRTVIRYYGLKFWREGQRFKVISGLFTRNEKTIQQRKIQLVRWATSPLKQLFGIFQLNIYQAASVEQHANKSLAIPGCYQAQVDQTLDLVMPGYRSALFTTHRIHRGYVQLMVTLLGFLPALLLGWLAWWNGGFLQWLLVLVFPLAVWMGILYQRKRRLHIHPDYLLSESGIFGRSFKLVEIYKIQHVSLSSSARQRRAGVRTLHLRTAGGHITVPYLDMHVARALRDYILFRVETEHRPWM